MNPVVVCSVAPFAGAWIETGELYHWNCRKSVAPFAGAWIETIIDEVLSGKPASLPSRERGLKLVDIRKVINLFDVAPFAGAWIETLISGFFRHQSCVAPFAGAWIETSACGRTLDGA